MYKIFYMCEVNTYKYRISYLSARSSKVLPILNAYSSVCTVYFTMSWRICQLYLRVAITINELQS